MPETTTRAKRKTSASKRSSSSGSSTGGSSSSKHDKAISHIAQALNGIADRVVFLSENDQLNVKDHLAAAVGNAQEAKAAEERIAERTPAE